MNQERDSIWPALDYTKWADTCATLQLWTQIVGKIRLETTPWVNHSWHVPLYVNARGLTTSLMHVGDRGLEIQFDFLAHVLDIVVSDGRMMRLPLRPQSVAAFQAGVLKALRDLDMPVAISDFPCEIAGAVAFSADTAHSAYDAEYVARFHRVLLQAARLFALFRTSFIGKASPVHFFWGSFDLAVTRFSGRRAPLHPGIAPGVAPVVMQEAYSHEVSSAGFWPGGGGQDALFYSYAYPVPAGFDRAPVRPAEARYDAALGEFVLPYAAVRAAVDPDAAIMEFLTTTYAAAADLAGWQRDELEGPTGRIGICRDPS